MNCDQAKNLLSAYIDEELSPDSRSLVSKHLETCSACADELAAFQHLSRSTSELSHPELPATIWQDLKARLDDEAGSTVTHGKKRVLTIAVRWVSIAALLLVAVTFGLNVHHNWDGHSHEELAVDFSHYLDAFQEQPGDAHLVLVNKYAGQSVELDQADTLLGYRPTLAAGLPEGYSIQTSFVMDMPCCKCIKSICKRSDGGTLAIFEHDDEQPIWFGDRPSVQAKCGGQSCSVIQMDGQIAVSWKQGHRHLTIVGLKDRNEASELIAYLNTSAIAPKLTG